MDYFRPSARNDSNNHTYNFIARVFQAVPIKAIPLEILPTLPHCQFPIGPEHGKGKLKIALDLCAGVNNGHLEFHKAMADTTPELVAAILFTNMEKKKSTSEEWKCQPQHSRSRT